MWKFLTAFTGADKSIFPAIYLHHQVLAPSDELIFCVNNRLEKSEILQDNNLSELHLIGGKTIWAETWPRGQPCVACSDQPMNYYCRDIKYQTVRPSPSKTQLLSRPRWDGKIWLTGAQTNCGDQAIPGQVGKIFANQNCSTGHIYFGILKYRKGHGRFTVFQLPRHHSKK